MIKTIINENVSKVNALHLNIQYYVDGIIDYLDNQQNLEDFNKFVDEQKETERYTKQQKLFLSLIPKAQLSAVKWKIKKKYNNNLQTFIDTRKVFLTHFTEKLRDYCDDEVLIDDDLKRKKKKLKKEALLYSSQLLGLVGKNGESYLNKALVC